MSYVTQNWSFDPVAILMALTVVAYEIGLSRLSRRSRRTSQRQRRRRSFIFYGGLVTLGLAIMSPLDYWSSHYFFVHMIDHLLLAFFAPILIVLGAPWVPLQFFLPVRARRALGRFLFLSSGAGWLRAIGRGLRSPIFAVSFFNFVMIFWHIPVVYDYSDTHQLVHIWLMHTSFLVAGILFWLQILSSHPFHPVRGPVWQGGVILLTNAVMTVMAMSMSIMTNSSWYNVYAHVAGVTMAPLTDQQIGAAILWVCGDFWALPMLGMVIRRAIREEKHSGSLADRLFRPHDEVLEIAPVVRGRRARN
ncbi:MAG: cytochrome c oxidase assembly protein [Acidimicrobiaceae bacterium]|nr:cytochrome c oxidase assembly protein [Acidimicrobiaceae bacterium]